MAHTFCLDNLIDLHAVGKCLKKQTSNMLCCLFSANPVYHELLLTVLWYGVVHTSALVRCTAARMFEVQHTHTHSLES